MDVDDDQVGLVLADGTQELARVPTTFDDLEARAGKQRDQAFTQQYVVIDHDDTAAAAVHDRHYRGVGRVLPRLSSAASRNGGRTPRS